MNDVEIYRSTKLYGIDELRRAAFYYKHMGTDFNRRFTAEELIKLWRFVVAHPELNECVDTWTDAQIKEALR